MESATCCGMELARSVVWNHHEVMYGIKPQGNEEYSLTADSIRGRAAMPYSAQSALIPYQACGLDRKKALAYASAFFLAEKERFELSNRF